MENSGHQASVALPRVAITFCTQCRWMLRYFTIRSALLRQVADGRLRAAYFGQELLSTFGTSIGEIALIPATGGIFTVELTYRAASKDAADDIQTLQVLIWDFKQERRFPETKLLKQRIRDHIEPGKNLGHSDTPSSAKSAAVGPDQVEVKRNEDDLPADNKQAGAEKCEDC